MTEVYRTELTPLSFLERSAMAYPTKTAIVHEGREITYQEMSSLASHTASALRTSGIEPGDRVAYLCPNIPEMLIAHFAVPLVGGVLVAINTRLSPEEIRYILDHSGSRILIGDTELLGALEPVIDGLQTIEEIIAIDGTETEVPYDTTAWATFLDRGSDDDSFHWAVDDEERTISINYTSGTTGRPKGVMYTHRGAYLNALGEIIHSRHSPDSVYLWTLPMFHCNGWCTTWAVTAIGGTHVCLRKVDPGLIWTLIDDAGVTHLNAAPTVLISLVNDPAAHPFPRPLTVTTAGAPPSPTIIGAMEDLGARLVHVYGLTETYGPHTVCEIQPGVAEMDAGERAKFMARQGVSYIVADPTRVVDEEMGDVTRNATEMGEVVMRGNNVMKGYFANPAATTEAFRGGYFHSGDVAVWHPDNYIDLRDRSKDIIISGGENISTIEVERTIASHPAVLECAVVAVPHEKWGERPKAFVVMKNGAEAEPEQIIEHVRAHLARFKAPDEVDIVDELPKTSTGKVQKYVLREKEWTGHERRIH
jgi:fatty-acyl-CoA synthase